MGIDVYLIWRNQTTRERNAQYCCGLQIDQGKVGYLREAYHGGPYATQVLIPEGWEDDDAADDGERGIPILAETLRERLPATVMVAIYRDFVVYQQGCKPGELKGDAVAALEAVKRIFTHEVTDRSAAALVKSTTPEQIEQAKSLIEHSVRLPEVARSFVDFVKLAERMERKTGEPCRVMVSA